MSRITTVKDKIPKKASWPGFLASGKDSRTKVVLARKLEKQGLGSTPELGEQESRPVTISQHKVIHLTTLWNERIIGCSS